MPDHINILSCTIVVGDGSDEDTLNTPITAEEVHIAINSLEEHKARA